jgi:serine/threonine protein kinase
VSEAEPHRIGPWIIGECLGSGGNAEVYKVTRQDKREPVALKVIFSKKAHSEPYRRFVREVEFLRGLTIDDGVLPLLDASVPVRPDRENRAWLAMPVAEPIRQALSGSSLENVVEAVATVAEALARLAERGIAHRDVKPGNLYRLNGRWLVGDFGLIDVPDLEQLTTEGKPIGPVHFTAYELLVNAATLEDARPADVYSLGKTLWVLATEQSYPPGGHQPAGASGFGIADLRPHAHAGELDRLVDSMTQLRTTSRPTMAQVVRDLRVWQELAKERPQMDLDDIRERLRAKLRPQLEEFDSQKQLLSHMPKVTGQVLTLMDPMNIELRNIHPGVDFHWHDAECDELLHSRPGERRSPTIFFWYTASRVAFGPENYPLELKLGCGVELDSDGCLTIRTLIISGVMAIADGNHHFWLGTPQRAPVGSIESESVLQMAIAEMSEHFPEALEYVHSRLG